MTRPPEAGADQVGNLTAQARTISQELVQEELEADAYQQQYSVASAQVAADQRAIAATQLQIRDDRQQIAQRMHRVEKIAIASYVLNGSVSSSSGASLFAENVSTVQSANEYATITIGNLNEAVDKLHSAQRSVQGTLQVLVRQSDRDRAEQTAQANYLAQSTSTVSQMESVQARVTGQLAEAVAQQNAALGQAAAAAVATAQKATVQKSGGKAPTPGPGPVVVSVTTTDPALNAFLQCVVQAESGGDYQAVSPNGLYMGAFQFSQSTWNYAAQAAGLGSLVGVRPNTATKAEQDTVAVALYALDGERPWLGDRCS
jgi:Transglycosylase-like domain